MTRPLMQQMAAFFRLPAAELLGLLTEEEKLHLIANCRQRRKRRTIIGRPREEIRS